MAFFTLRRASVHLYFSGLPIDLQVVVLEPGITEDHVLPSKTGDSKEHPFRVGFVMENYVYHFGDLTYLIGGAVHVVHWYGARDALGVNTLRMDKISIYKVAHSTGCHDLAKQLSHYLYFFSFLFFFFSFILDLLHRGKCGKVSHHKCHTVTVT